MLNAALQVAQKKVEERARCLRDKFFLADCLGYDFQPEAHAELFACFVQYDKSKPWDEQSSVKDRMVLWSRGHYKTTAVIVDIIQAVINFPNSRFIIMQGSLPVTKTLLRQIVSHFKGEALGSRFTELFPEHCGDKRALRHTSTAFTTCARTAGQLAQATVTCATAKSVKTGQHYDGGYFDDLVNDQNFRNPKLLQKLQEDFTLAQALVDPGCYRFVSGTRYAFGDLYEQIMRWQAKGGKWIISIKDCWTDDSANLPDREKQPRFPRFIKKNGQKGGFATDELLQMQEDDPDNFAKQYLNRPIASSRVVFTPEILAAATIAYNDAPALSTPIVVCDLASGESEKADDSVIAVGRVDAMGIAYQTEMRGGVWKPIEMALNIIDVALRCRPLKILLENTASAKYFADFLRIVAKQKNVYLPIDAIKVDNRPDAKNMRVGALAGQVRRGRFRFYKGLTNWDKLVEQACEFPKGRNGHDDYIDTAALLYQELSKELLAMPTRIRAGNNPIWALITDQENSLLKVFTQQPQESVNAGDVTGLE